jgi:outer membrane protein assembly factor BamB
MKRSLLIALASLGVLLCQSADWPQFRGPLGNAVSPETLPGTGSPAITWAKPLPGRGLSSPIIVGERVFVTCSSGPKQERLHVVCFRASDGSKIWERQFWATGRTMCQEKTSVAAPTPASDGRYVYAIFSSNDIVCLDLDGNLIWLRGLMLDYPNASNSVGMASSLVVEEGVVVAMLENDSDSITVGLSADTGRNRWKLSRPKMANWTSPLPVRNDRGVFVLLQSGKGLTCISPKTGQTVWEYTDGASTITSTAVSGGILYAPSHGITALQPNENQPPKQLWRAAALRPGMSSPVVTQDRLFVLNEAGVLTAASVKDGGRIWQLRLKGPFSSTPVLSGSRLYCFSEKGLVQVVDITAPEGAVLHELELQPTILATPAISGQALYIRNNSTLWKITPGH